jgi:putative flippase GtrA
MLAMNIQEKRDAKAIVTIGVALGVLVQPILANNLDGSVLTPGVRIGFFILLILVAVLALVVARIIAYVWQPIYQFAKFGAVGTLNSFVDIGVFNLETFLWGSSAIGLVAFAIFKAISFLCATTNSFFWNKSWTFSDREHARPKLVSSFYGIAAVGWAVNVGVATFVKAIGPGMYDPNFHLWTNVAAPLAGILASFILNFVGYKYFVFRKKHKVCFFRHPESREGSRRRMALIFLISDLAIRLRSCLKSGPAALGRDLPPRRFARRKRMKHAPPPPCRRSAENGDLPTRNTGVFRGGSRFP